jgi:hypothetical protein
MNQPVPVSLEPMPPRLSMDEYVEFVANSLREHDSQLALRQKAVEKRIQKPFCLSEFPPTLRRRVL